MAELGWTAEFGTEGSTGFEGSNDDKIGVSFYRWWWHDKRLTCPVTISARTKRFSEFADLVEETAAKAKKAYEDFPDYPVEQKRDGTIVQDENWYNKSLG